MQLKVIHCTVRRDRDQGREGEEGRERKGGRGREGKEVKVKGMRNGERRKEGGSELDNDYTVLTCTSSDELCSGQKKNTAPCFLISGT